MADDVRPEGAAVVAEAREFPRKDWRDPAKDLLMKLADNLGLLPKVGVIAGVNLLNSQKRRWPKVKAELVRWSHKPRIINDLYGASKGFERFRLHPTPAPADERT